MPHPRMSRLVRLATLYDEDTGNPTGDGEEEPVTFEMPEDLTALDDAELGELRDQAVEAFNALYEQDGELTAEDVETMEQLADAADAVRGEETRRSEERQANREAAEALATRVHGSDEDEEQGEEGGEEPPPADGGEDTTGEEGDGQEQVQEEPELVTAGGRRSGAGPLSINLSRLRSRQSAPAPQDEGRADRAVLLASADIGGGLSAGQSITTMEAAEALNRKAGGLNEQQYQAAYRSGNRLSHSIPVASVRKSFPESLIAGADNGQEILDAAADEHRLPGGSLVAAGGWCSPSETLYDLFGDTESTDGLVSVPEMQVARGGVRFTRGPNFADLFAAVGFSFSESEDEAGTYEPGTGENEGSLVEGDKPCFKVDCEDFTEERLGVDGLCITAGILQNRAWPELTDRTIRGALVAHQHRLAGKVIDAIADDSTEVTMPAGQVGALAPVLTAIELQVEHYRYVHRMSRATTLEMIAPFWLRGLVRSDLSRRLGVPLESITNAVIGAHFAERGVNVQFVYNYQDITGGADAFTEWPTEVKFLLYAAGTWVRGSSDLITLEAIFDSALLRQNDFTALFSEEGWLVARRGHDSREVTVPVAATGATHGGVEIAHDGTQAT